MTPPLSFPRCAVLIAIGVSSATAVLAVDPPEPKFRAVTIDDQIQIGYGLAVADVDGDKQPDILLADKKQIVWYRNPGPAAPNATPRLLRQHCGTSSSSPKS